MLERELKRREGNRGINADKQVDRKISRNNGIRQKQTKSQGGEPKYKIIGKHKNNTSRKGDRDKV